MTAPSANPQLPWDAHLAARRVYTRDAEWATGGRGGDGGWVGRLLASCHPYQRAVVDELMSGLGVVVMLLAVLVGRGGGKTTVSEAALLITMGIKPRAKCLFVTDTKEHARDIAWEKFKDIIGKLGIEARFNETRLTITFKANGSVLKLAGADDKAAVEKFRGIPYDAVVVDEAASWIAELLEWFIDRGVRPRLGERRGWLLMIGTPGHNLSGPFYEHTRPGGNHSPYAERDLRPPGWRGWSSHVWNVADAAKHVDAIRLNWEEALATKEEKGWLDTNPIWMREYLGLWAADATDAMFKFRAYLDDGTTEWNVWGPSTVGPMKVAKLPTDRADWLWVLSLDRGSADEFAINGFAFSPSDPAKRIYHVLCYEQKRLYARQVACLLLGTRAPGDVDAILSSPAPDAEKAPPEPRSVDAPDSLSPFGVLGYPVGGVCDSDQTLIDELWRVYGIRCVQAKRAREEKHGAIELLNGDLVEGRFKVIKGSRLEEQMRTLQWTTDQFEQLVERKGTRNHCLVAGTMVLTSTGERPIESIRIGDRVQTRAGLRPVLWSGMTGIRSTVTVAFTNGRSISGTPDHPVWTEGRGWADLALLTANDTVVSCERTNTDRASPSCSRARRTGAIPSRTTPASGATTPHRRGALDFTARSGSRFVAQFLRASTFITSTEIASTTGSRTSPSSTAASIYASTWTTPRERSSRAADSDLRGSLPLRGTARPRVALGTLATPRTRSVLASTRACAESVAPHSSPRLAQPSCAAPGAAPRIGETAARTTSSSSANSAATRSSATASPATRVSALRPVSTATANSVAEPVYDLTVDGAPEFFANGVLVHNSADTACYARKLIAHLFEIGSVAGEQKPPTARRDRHHVEPDPDDARPADTAWWLTPSAAFEEDDRWP